MTTEQSFIGLDDRKRWQREDGLYVFKPIRNDKEFILIPAPDSELATLRAWVYDTDLMFFSGIQGFLKLMDEGKIQGTIREPNTECIK